MTRPDPIILALDAAGAACSAAVAAGGRLLAVRRLATRHGQAEALLPLVDAAMREAQLAPAALELVAVTVGPGGFTGVRVGLAAARGIALATGARLVGVTSFAAIAALLPPGEARLVAIDSRREELYVQLFDGAGQALGDPAALGPAALPAAVAAAVAAAPLIVAGDAGPAAMTALAGRPQTRLAAGTAADACGVLHAAWRLLRSGGDGLPARPLYLRPPDTTPPPAPGAAR